MNNPIHLTTVVARNGNSLPQTVRDKNIIINGNFGPYFAMNPVASKIWEILELPKSVKEICEKLMLEYEMDYDYCRLEVITFLKDLLNKKIIQIKQ